MRFLFLFLLFSTSFLTGQVTDDFSDSDFINNPIWVGDTADWKILDGQLNSNSNNSSTGFYLSTASSLTKNAQWELFVDLKFQTSSANYTDIYLTSDSANLKNANNNGYFVRIGNTSDEISLYKSLNGNSVEIIDGIDSEVNSSNNKIKIKVVCDDNHLWTLKSNLNGDGYGYITEGTVTDSSVTTSNYFGIFVQQSTATFHYNHFYDNIYVGPIIKDSVPPTIQSATIISNTQIDLLFNETIDLITSQTAGNYSADNGLGTPISATRDATNFNLIHLVFSNSFTDGKTNTVTVKGIQDLEANISTLLTTQFSFIIPATALFKNIIINEIFADPTPQVGLPPVEFIELYNKSERAFDLSGWKFTDGSSTSTLNSYTLVPGEYLIICPKADTALYNAFGSVMGLSSFPVLNNSGDHIYLKNNSLTVIDSVIYSDSWYGDAIKKTGGWSLELINPNANKNCPVSNYWTASVNPIGGTPGRINSTYSLIDNEAPKLISAVVISKNSIQLNFNDYLDNTTTMSTKTYSIDNGIGNPVQVNTSTTDPKSIQLTLNAPLEGGIDYTITLANTIANCSGISIGQNIITHFVIPEMAVPNDIVINEILFDPNTNGVDFVEIYNRSKKIIDLKTLTISQYDTINNLLKSIENISSDTYLIHPMEYILLSENGAAVKSQYQTINPDGFLDIHKLPSMSISNGTVCVATSSEIIDLFKYNEGMHFPLLNITKGVSLERIDFDRPSQDNSNWHSAAEAIGFATPAYKNSQYSNGGETDNAIEIKPELFSPDEDGLNDVVNINYHLDTPGLMANVTVYDSRGRSIKQIAKNELLGKNGTFTWDGIDENREKAKIGIYLFFVETIDLTGKVKHYKKTCVLAGKL